MKKMLVKVFSFTLIIVLGLFSSVSAKEENKREQSNSFFQAEMLYKDVVCNKEDITTKILKNINGDSQYVLIEGENSYLIFDTYLDDFIEFSSLCDSPYLKVCDEYEIIYFPVGNYFYVNDGKYYSINDNSALSGNDLTVLRKEMPNIQNKIVNNKEISKEKDRALMDSGSVQYSYYFERLINNKGTDNPLEYTGSCGYVAIGMILSYYDSIINDNVIAETYDVTSSKSFSSYSSILASSYSQSPGIDDTFHSSLISLGRSQGYTSSTSYSISDFNIPFFFEDYFASRNMSCTSYYEDASSSVVQFIKSAISSGYPVAIHITGIDTFVDYRYLDHDVVGYKYDSNGIYVNMGWQNSQTSICISNYTIESATYVTISNSHSHSNNYVWTYSGCNGTVCPCGNKTCNHGSYSYTQNNATTHKKICNACGSQQNEAHHFQYVSGNDVCSDCGYSKTHQHSYDNHYQWTSLTEHKSYCSCNGYITSSHVVSPDAYNNGLTVAPCLLCGGFASIGEIWHDGIGSFPYTLNGSFILPNGVIVLEEADMEAYLNGTLVFINPNENINRGNNQIPYIVKNEDYNIVIRR